MPTDGWFKAHRSIFRHPLFMDDPACRAFAFMDLVGMAEFEPKRRSIKGQIVDVQRGQFVASVRFLCDRWKWSHGRVQRFLAEMESENMIGTVSGTPSGTVYCVVNYDTYQDMRYTERDAERHGDGTPTARIEERKNLPTPPSTDAGERATALPADTDIARLRLYLGEHAPAVEMMLQSAEHPPNWISAVLGKFGPTGTQAQVWTGIPSERRPAVIATVLMEYATGGKQFENRHFDGYMRKATTNERNGNQSGGPRIETPSPPRAATGTDGTYRDSRGRVWLHE